MIGCYGHDPNRSEELTPSKNSISPGQFTSVKLPEKFDYTSQYKRPRISIGQDTYFNWIELTNNTRSSQKDLLTDKDRL